MNEPAASRKTRARTETPVESSGIGDDAHGARERGPDGDQDGGPGRGHVMSRTPTSGAKGFAVILGAMLGIIGLLWLIATLVAPH